MVIKKAVQAFTTYTASTELVHTPQPPTKMADKKPGACPGSFIFIAADSTLAVAIGWPAPP